MILILFTISCGGDGGEAIPPSTYGAAYAPTLVPLSNVEASCKLPQSSGAAAQQQMQTKFQQVQQNTCTPQLQFSSSRLADFIVQLDCAQRLVFVQTKGAEQSGASFPVQTDGSVKGEMQFQQRVQNDGQGHALCWVNYIVNFEGRANCTGAGTLSLDTAVQFASSEPTSFNVNPELDYQVSPTPSPSQGQGQNPGQNPGQTPSPSPRPSATPTPSPSPSPSPTPTRSPGRVVITPVEVCVIQRPCPVVGKIDYSCPAQPQ